MSGPIPRRNGLWLRFVQGVMRWGARAAAYAFVLVADRYPPFSLAL